MCPALDYPSLIEDQDAVAILNCRQSMRYHKGSPSLHKIIHTLLYEALCPGIHGACRFIQYQDRRICGNGSCNIQKLPLSFRKTVCVICERRLVMVVFPDPVLPTIAIFCPGSAPRLTSYSICIPGT